MKHCDICGKDKYLIALKSEYATKEIKEVCDDCMKILNDHVLQSKVLCSWLERFMMALKEKFNGRS